MVKLVSLLCILLVSSPCGIEARERGNAVPFHKDGRGMTANSTQLRHLFHNDSPNMMAKRTNSQVRPRRLDTDGSNGSNPRKLAKSAKNQDKDEGECKKSNITSFDAADLNTDGVISQAEWDEVVLGSKEVQPTPVEVLLGLDELEQALDGANQLTASTQQEIQTMREGVKELTIGETAPVSLNITAADLKPIYEFAQTVSKEVPNLQSNDPNTIWKASFTIAAAAAKHLDKIKPPLGTALNSIFTIVGSIAFWPKQEEPTMEELLTTIITDTLRDFADQALMDEYTMEMEKLATNQRTVDNYQRRTTEQLTSDPNYRETIYKLLHSDAQRDSGKAFMSKLERYIGGLNVINDGFYEQTRPDRVTAYSYAYMLLVQARVQLFNLKAALLARMGYTQSAEDKQREIGETYNDARRLFNPLTFAPDYQTSGISRVLRSFHVDLTSYELQLFKSFVEDELHIRIPGKLLKIQNFNEQYLVVSQDSCPQQKQFSEGFRNDVNCRWVETTPGMGFIDEWAKIFIVYGNQKRFRIWSVGEGAYLRLRESFLPRYYSNGKAYDSLDWYYKWAGAVPIKFEVEYDIDKMLGGGWEYTRNGYFTDYILRKGLVNQASCYEFEIMSDFSPFMIFARCQNNDFFAQWNMYSTDWGTGVSYGNGRLRNQVLAWTRDLNGDPWQPYAWHPTTGFWLFRDLFTNSVFDLPSDGQL